jgi:raffinose/stachyose/melibiose transport system substrate-binding protein
MPNRRNFLKLVTAVGASSTILATSACQSGSLSGSKNASGGEVATIKFLHTNDATNTALAKALSDAFNASQTKYRVTLESRPGGTEGDNLVKTRLSTGEMTDVFMYNSGSLMNNLNPSKNLIPFGDEAYVKDYTKPFTIAVTSTTDKKIYGAPFGAGSGGGIMYNRKVYADLGLKVPDTWDQFMANNAKIKAAGKTAVLQTYGTTWTSQLFVLADFANINTSDANWGTDYTANKKKYSNAPALAGFQHTEDVFKAGYINTDAASLTLDNGLKKLALGDAVHFPVLSGVITTVQQNNPDKVADLGFFPIPTTLGSTSTLTTWVPSAFYIPVTTKDKKLEAVKAFIAFAEAADGCKAQLGAASPNGPFGMATCVPTGNLPQVATDVFSYSTKNQFGPALEFISPLKGPNLESIIILVGTGQKTAAQAAALYDEDLKKQAAQLNLPGW